MIHHGRYYHCNKCGFEPVDIDQIDRLFYPYQPKICKKCQDEYAKSRQEKSIYFEVHAGFDNPVPYKRTTQRAKHCDTGYKRYQIWKDKVLGSFVSQIGCFPHQKLEKDRKYHVDVMIYFKNKKHGDPDNVAKGINDSVFQKPLNDKYIAGSYDFAYDKIKPRVEVKISEKGGE